MRRKKKLLWIFVAKFLNFKNNIFIQEIWKTQIVGTWTNNIIQINAQYLILNEYSEEK